MKKIFILEVIAIFIFLMALPINLVHATGEPVETTEPTEVDDSDETVISTTTSATSIDTASLQISNSVAASVPNGTSSSEAYRGEEKKWEYKETKSVAEKVFTMYFLGFGDHANEFLHSIFNQDVTIDTLVFNEVDMINANFFENTPNAASTGVSELIREFINRWFEYFRELALIIILITIVGAGIKILLHTPQAKANAYESFKKVVFATMLVFFFPYVMRFAFDINEALIEYIRENVRTMNTDIALANAISEASDIKPADIEFRSPKYVTIERNQIMTITKEATEVYLNKLKEYQKTADVMRMMRAFAGVTYRFTYVIIWYIMLAQVYILAFIYVKRYLTIAFLLAVYPLVVIGYVIDGVVGKRKTAFNAWCRKFFSTVLLQTLHAVMYGIISGILLNQTLRLAGGDPDKQQINVILMIVATSFLFSGEKILGRFWKHSIDADTSRERGGLRQAFGMPRRMIGQFKGK